MIFRFFLASTSVPSLTSTSLRTAPAKGAFRPMSDSSIARSRAAVAASMTEAPAFAIVAEPMEAWDAGNLVSPSRTMTLSGARPSVSAATCCMTV